MYPLQRQISSIGTRFRNSVYRKGRQAGTKIKPESQKQKVVVEEEEAAEIEVPKAKPASGSPVVPAEFPPDIEGAKNVSDYDNGESKYICGPLGPWSYWEFRCSNTNRVYFLSCCYFFEVQ